MRFLSPLLRLLMSLALLPALLPAVPLSAADDPGTEQAGRRLQIVATTTIIADMARRVGGDRVDVRSVLPPNVDPHDFEPAAADVELIALADMILYNGLGLEERWLGKLIANAGRDVPVNVLARGIEARHVEDGDDHHVHEGEHEDEEGGDPHIWQSAAHASVMAANIRDGFVWLDPAATDAYHGWTDEYLAELGFLDNWIFEQMRVVPEARRKMVTNHEAFGYYAERYGLHVAGSIFPNVAPGAEPSAREVAELIDRIRAEQVPAVFTENTLNPRLARQIAAGAGVRVVTDLYSDALGAPGSEAGTYVDMMRYNTLLIVAALR